MATIYDDGTYLANNPTWHVEDSRWKAQQIAKLIQRHGLHQAMVSEVGCGAGEVLFQLAQMLPGAAGFHGYETSPQAFALCQGRAGDRLQFYLGDILAAPAAHYDLLLAIDLIEHIEDYFGFLRALREKGDRFIFHIPLNLSAQTVLRGRPLIYVRRQVGHIHYFTRDTAVAALQECGYELIDSGYTAGYLELPGRNWRTRMMAVPRRLLFALDRDLAVRALGGYSLLVLAK